MIHNSSFIDKRAIIGKEVKVGPFCYIGPKVQISDSGELISNVHIEGNVKIGNGQPIVLIAGPCVIESQSHVLKTAEKLKRVTSDAGVPFIFKASYDKANRSSIDSFRGPGLNKGLKILEKVKKEPPF